MNALLQTLRNLGPARLAAMAAVGLGMLGFLIYLMTRVGGSQTELLYGNLEPADSKRIIAELDAQKVPYDLRNNGTEVHVPGDLVLKLRVQLAETAMSGGATVGYEIFDKQNALGATNFMQNLNMVRALEGELARTIQAIDNIKHARVHLVLPQREMFSREERKPSASVVLRMKGGRLGKAQVTAIQNLVATAVPKLEPTAVSIIDDKGTLLARAFANQQDFIAATAEESRREYEARTTQAIEELLSRSLGPGKVRAEVSAQLDFDRVVTDQEAFDPDGQVVRSTTTVSDKAQTQDKEPESVTVGSNMPDAGLGGTANSSSSNNARTEEVVNYEISRKVTKRISETGSVRRLSVAVLVDGDYSVKGDPNSYQKRTEEEMEKLTALVRSAVGYDENRDDQIEVVNMRFAAVEDEGGAGAEIVFLGFTKPEIMRMAEGVGVAIVAVLVILLVVRPLVTRAFETLPAQAEAQRRLLEAQQAPQLAGPGLKALAPGTEPPPEFEGDELIDIDKVEGRVRASSLKKIGEIVDKHPEEALSIVRNWLYQEGV